MCVHLCKDLKANTVVPVRRETLLSFEHKKFPDGTVSIATMLDERVPGCCYENSMMIMTKETRILHPSYVVDCDSCLYYVSWHERAPGGTSRKVR